MTLRNFQKYPFFLFIVKNHTFLLQKLVSVRKHIGIDNFFLIHFLQSSTNTTKLFFILTVIFINNYGLWTSFLRIKESLNGLIDRSFVFIFQKSKSKNNQLFDAVESKKSDNIGHWAYHFVFETFYVNVKAFSIALKFLFHTFWNSHKNLWISDWFIVIWILVIIMFFFFQSKNNFLPIAVQFYTHKV